MRSIVPCFAEHTLKVQRPMADRVAMSYLTNALSTAFETAIEYKTWIALAVGFGAVPVIILSMIASAL